MGLAIRRAVPEDAAAISAVMCRAIAVTNAADHPPDVIDKLVARHDSVHVAAMVAKRTVFCAAEDQRVLGTIALETDQLRGLFVDPSRHGEGIGGLLVAHLEAYAAEVGMGHLWLQSSITALSFYQRRGYRPDRFVVRDDGSVTIMRKRPIRRGREPTRSSANQNVEDK